MGLFNFYFCFSFSVVGFYEGGASIPSGRNPTAFMVFQRKPKNVDPASYLINTGQLHLISNVGAQARLLRLINRSSIIKPASSRRTRTEPGQFSPLTHPPPLPLPMPAADYVSPLTGRVPSLLIAFLIILGLTRKLAASFACFFHLGRHIVHRSMVCFGGSLAIYPIPPSSSLLP